MPENMIFNVNFSQVSVLIIMDVFFTLCYKPVWKYSEKYFKVKMKTPQTFVSRPRNSDLQDMIKDECVTVVHPSIHFRLSTSTSQGSYM